MKINNYFRYYKNVYINVYINLNSYLGKLKNILLTNK